MDANTKKFHKIVKLITEDLKDNTDNITLDIYGRVLLRQYKGTFASDQVPVMNDGDSCIINLDRAGQPGSHWIGLYRQDKKNYIYDSFGRTGILDTLDGVYTEDDAEQHVDELNCGSFSLAWLWGFERFGRDFAMSI